MTSPKRKRGELEAKSMAEVIAYFISWSCYGTRLHGDSRGTVDREHNTPHTPYLAEDEERLLRARDRMTHAPFMLTAPAREVVDATIKKHCEIRAWALLALNVRTTHVHVVVDCQKRVSPETAMEQFKAWATRRLRESKHATADQKLWTQHGSTRWVDTSESLTEAIDYVLNHQ